MARPKFVLEETPVDPNELLQAIIDSTSQDLGRMKEATEKLKRLQEGPGAWDIIHRIACQRDLALPIRQMAIIQFKNGALSRWKSKRHFSDETRIALRTRCLQLLDETDDTISKCNAVVLAKIARADYPVLWPDMTSQLIGVLQIQMNSLINSVDISPVAFTMPHHILEVLGQVSKELSSMKMLTGVRAMQTFIDACHTELYTMYFSFWNWLNTRLLENNSSDPRLYHFFLLLHQIFKPLSRMMLWSWTRSDQTKFAGAIPILTEFFKNFVLQWSGLHSARERLLVSLTPDWTTSYEPLTNQITKHVSAIAKTFRKWQRASIPRFVKLEGGTEFIFECWNHVLNASRAPISTTPFALYPREMIVLYMALFRSSLSQWSPLRNSNNSLSVLNEVHVQNAVEVLITKFLPLGPSDLDKWLEDPEEWARVESKENDNWEFEIRPCSERLLATLCDQYPDHVVPMVVQAFRVSNTTAIDNLDGILQKEAIYGAVGCCTSRLKEVISFDQWVKDQLIPEVISEDPNFRILKRRIASIIGKWVGEFSNERPNEDVWNILKHLLMDHGESSDTVVRLATASAIKACIDTERFDLRLFVPVLQDITRSLLQLIAEVDTPENKRLVVESLNLVIERAQSEIAPVTGGILQALPILWVEAENNSNFLLKASLLDTMTRLVYSLKNHTDQLLPAALPLLKEALTPRNKVGLDSEALELWLALLRQSQRIAHPAPGQPTLVDLLPNLIDFLSNDLDILGTLLNILDGYIFLDSPVMLKGCARELFFALDRVMTSATAVNIKGAVNSIQWLTMLAPSNLWTEPLLVTGLFLTLLKNIREEKLEIYILTEHISLFARIAVLDPIVFLHLINSAADRLGISENIMLHDILDQWFEKFDNMSEPRQRKLSAMGIASLVTTGHAEVLKRLPNEILNLWLDCFAEIKETVDSEKNGLNSPLTLHWQSNVQALSTFIKDAEGSSEEMRRREIFETDPVQKVMLASYIDARLKEAEAAVGGSMTFESQFFFNADPRLLQQLKDARLERFL